ncbi:MAG: ABC transporter substrate-binding protein [Huintestinicola sp.]
MMKKSLFIRAAALTAAAVILSSCASEPVVLSQDEYTEISLSWWGNDTRIEYTLEAIKKFEELNPNIRVKCSYSEWSGYQNRNNIRMISDTESDVMLINFAWLDQFSADGEGYYDISTLSEYFDMTQFDENELQFGIRNGRQNAVPIALNAMTEYYNDSVYADFGLEIPETWDDLFNAANVMGDDIYPTAMTSKSSLFFTISYTEQLTGKRFMTDEGKLNFNKDDIKVMLEFYSRLINEHVMPQVEYFDKNCIKNGTYAGCVAWLSDAENYMGPAADAGYTVSVGKYTTLPGCSCSGLYTKPATMYAVSVNTVHPKEAAMLLDFLMNSSEMAELQGIEKGIPLSRAAKEYLETNDMLKGLQYDAFCRMNTRLDEMKLIAPFMEDGEVLDAYQEACNAVLYGKKTADEKAEELYLTLIGILEEKY